MEGKVANILIDTLIKTIQILGNGLTTVYAVISQPPTINEEYVVYQTDLPRPLNNV
jgi:hypothetical protein